MTRKKGRRKPITAAELMAQLDSDPEFVERQRKADEELARRSAQWKRAERPLVEELRAAGLAVDSVWDLVNSSSPYPNALPILLQHLDRPYPDRVREGIARALAVPDAKYAWGTLVELFRSETGPDTKTGLACAISATATDEVMHDVVALVRDRQNGPNRVLLLDALARSKQPEAMATLVEMSDDPELEQEIDVLLERIRKRKRKPGSKLH